MKKGRKLRTNRQELMKKGRKLLRKRRDLPRKNRRDSSILSTSSKSICTTSTEDAMVYPHFNTMHN
jgi:hypothetical protein